MEKAVLVREATREDCLAIRQLIQELADFEEESNGPKIDYKVLEKDGFDRENPLFECFVAVHEGRIVGHAVYFYVYTTLNGKTVHIEDLYVVPDFRRKHIGSRLFDSVAKKASDERCQYLDFTVLSWNPAKGFYQTKGAVNMTDAEGWHGFRINHESLLKLTTKSSGNGNYIVREATSNDFDTIRKLAEDAYSTQNVSISKYKKPNSEISMNDKASDDYYGYFVVELNKKVVGYALYCSAYSTWEGRSMYLPELYVSSNEHSENMKLDLLSAVAKKTCEKGCCRLEFWVSDMNAGKFYIANGAVDHTDSEAWNMYKLFELIKKPA